MGDEIYVGVNLRSYILAIAPAVRGIFEGFEFHTQIDKPAKAGFLNLVTEKFTNIDLHPSAVSNAQMVVVFESLMRKFAELSGKTAGEHLASLHPDAQLVMYGQELNAESYAIRKAGMLIKGRDIANIISGNNPSGKCLACWRSQYQVLEACAKV